MGSCRWHARTLLLQQALQLARRWLAVDVVSGGEGCLQLCRGRWQAQPRPQAGLLAPLDNRRHSAVRAPLAAQPPAQNDAASVSRPNTAGNGVQERRGQQGGPRAEFGAEAAKSRGGHQMGTCGREREPREAATSIRAFHRALPAIFFADLALARAASCVPSAHRQLHSPDLSRASPSPRHFRPPVAAANFPVGAPLQPIAQQAAPAASHPQPESLQRCT